MFISFSQFLVLGLFSIVRAATQPSCLSCTGATCPVVTIPLGQAVRFQYTAPSTSSGITYKWTAASPGSIGDGYSARPGEQGIQVWLESYPGCQIPISVSIANETCDYTQSLYSSLTQASVIIYCQQLQTGNSGCRVNYYDDVTYTSQNTGNKLSITAIKQYITTDSATYISGCATTTALSATTVGMIVAFIIVGLVIVCSIITICIRKSRMNAMKTRPAPQQYIVQQTASYGAPVQQQIITNAPPAYMTDIQYMPGVQPSAPSSPTYYPPQGAAYGPGVPQQAYSSVVPQQAYSSGVPQQAFVPQPYNQWQGGAPQTYPQYNSGMGGPSQQPIYEMNSIQPSNPMYSGTPSQSPYSGYGREK